MLAIAEDDLCDAMKVLFIIPIISYNHDLSFYVINYGYISMADGTQAFQIIFAAGSPERLVLAHLFEAVSTIDYDYLLEILRSLPRALN